MPRARADGADTMKICRFIDIAGAGGPGAGGGGDARVGYLDGDVIVPVAAGEGRDGMEAVLDLAMAANADPGLRPRGQGEPVPLAGARLLARWPSRPRSGTSTPSSSMSGPPGP